MLIGKARGELPTMRIAELREEGIGLRNQLLQTADPQETRVICEALAAWKERATAAVAQLSKVEAGLFSTLDRFPMLWFWDAVEGADVRAASMYSEWIRRLTTIFDRWVVRS